MTCAKANKTDTQIYTWKRAHLPNYMTKYGHALSDVAWHQDVYAVI